MADMKYDISGIEKIVPSLNDSIVNLFSLKQYASEILLSGNSPKQDISFRIYKQDLVDVNASSEKIPFISFKLNINHELNYFCLRLNTYKPYGKIGWMPNLNFEHFNESFPMSLSGYFNSLYPTLNMLRTLTEDGGVNERLVNTSLEMIALAKQKKQIISSTITEGIDGAFIGAKSCQYNKLVHYCMLLFDEFEKITKEFQTRYKQSD